MKIESMLAVLSPSKQKAPRVIFMIGPPGSGKSTWRDAYLSSTDRKTTIISTDDMIEELAAAAGKTYSEIFGELDRDVLEKQAIRAFRRAIARREDVIIDRTNMTVISRNKWLSMVSPTRYARIAVVFDVPMDTLIDRLRERGRATGKIIPMPVVMDMLASYQAPTTQEFDCVQVLQ